MQHADGKSPAGQGPSLASLASVLDKRLDTVMKKKRARHSRAVANLAAELCGRHGLDPEAGWVAGLAHDLCKEYPYPEQERLAKAWARDSGMVLPASLLLGKAILHGPAAAGLLGLEYGLRDRDILEAVAWHTIGAPEMGNMAFIVYAADKLEPGRERIDPAFRSACLGLSPEELFFRVLESSLRWLREHDMPIDEGSQAMYDALRIRMGPQ